MIYKLLSYLGWLIVTGFYLLIRFYGTGQREDWATTGGAVFLVWIISSLVFYTFFEIGNLVSERRQLRRLSYIKLIFVRIFLVVFSTVLVIFATRLIANLEESSSSADIILSTLTEFHSKPMQIFMLYLTLATMVLAFVRQMGFMVGPKMLLKLMLGQYLEPSMENRIFMFLDLKNSTAHGEQLGHQRFFKLIQDCFHDLTDSAVLHDVEIYQYVGDEAILTWDVNSGIRNSNCVSIFWDFEKRLNQNGNYYMEEYGFIPKFKAGLNMGPVTVAQIGDIKREIAYLSDVLNTASRIESACNIHHQQLLASGAIRDMLCKDPRYRFDSIGLIHFKGKEKEEEIFAVVPNGETVVPNGETMAG